MFLGVLSNARDITNEIQTNPTLSSAVNSAEDEEHETRDSFLCTALSLQLAQINMCLKQELSTNHWQSSAAPQSQN